MARTRSFDYDEAIRLRAAGLTYVEIGKRFGVSNSAIYLACNPKRRAAAIAYTAEWQRQGVCIDCGAQCTRIGGQPMHRCRECWAVSRSTTVRDDELRCITCHEWKPDTDYPRSRNIEVQRRRGRHRQCRVCTTEAKRVYRAKTKVPCSHGCGRFVNTADRRDKTLPPQCFYCAMNRRYGYTDTGHAA